MAVPFIGARLKALREAQRMSQEDLARAFGFNDRQTVSAIETGERRMTADELLIAVEKLGASLDDFTDPFRLAGEGTFSWRQTNVGQQRLSAYERNAGRWIAAFRTMAPQVGFETPLLRQALGLTRHSRFEEASAAGERFAQKFELGEVPARRLADAMEHGLGVLVLMVDAFEGISGAACRLPELDAVLINRQEVPGRRNFDLAHELFHILTWDAMPPEPVEEATEISKNRVEQLANSFASAVLMPAAVIDRFGDWPGEPGPALVEKLRATANALAVTATALRWRLVSLDRLALAVARAIPDAALRSPKRDLFSDGKAAPLPPPFSKSFVEVIARAVAEGQLSARRAAGLLDLTLDDLGELCRAHGIEAPVEL